MTELSPTREQSLAVDALAELDQLARRDPLTAWDPESALPWADPEFSARMLRRHLDPGTPSGSRPGDVIARHGDWLAARLATGPVLDLCCGPGLYCHELARRGIRTVGVDVAPAAIAWAREQSATDGLDCIFLESDLGLGLPAGARNTRPWAAVTCWFGDIHAFPRPAATRLLEAACAGLADDGLLVLEMQPWEGWVHEDDSRASTVENGVFCDHPHHWVQRHRWDATAETEVHGHWIRERESGRLTRYVQCHQAWRPDRFAELLHRCGLEHAAWHEPITGLDAGYEFPVLVARRATAGGGP